MRFEAFVEELLTPMRSAGTDEELADILARATVQLGFEYFALTHHVDIMRAPTATVRLHNYPARWVEYYDAAALGVSDPVHRASHVTSVGFSWSDLPKMISLTPEDRRVLMLGRAQGIGEGFTVPANVPGEARGSCTFASGGDRAATGAVLSLAQLTGAFAFEAARKLYLVRPASAASAPVLTDRQRDCVLWVARGKSDWEISRILGISEETVIRHLKHARERYGVQKRTLLAIRAVFDGSLSFSDVLRR